MADHAGTTAAELRLRLEGVTKRFVDEVAVASLDLEVASGEIVALLGPSGCGKTTTLRLVAGFERADAGTVTIDGTVVEGGGVHVPPEKRRVGVVFQDYALFPHLDVAGNVAFGLPRTQRRSRDGNGRVGELLDLVGLAGTAERRPHELSGGQQQRVALARALAPDPALVMLDEPFSNLDAALRQRMRAEVETILRGAGATAIFVTHSQEEALSMADRVAVMSDGALEQVAAPEDLYRRPATPFVAEFIADATVVEGEVDTGGMLTTPAGRTQIATTASPPAGRVQVALRPESVVLTPTTGGAARVCDREYYGHDEVVTVELSDGTRIRSRRDADHILALGDHVDVALAVDLADVYPVE